MRTRRGAAQFFATAAMAVVLAGTGMSSSWAADTTLKVGLDASLTGADSESAVRVRNGVSMAIEEANDANAIPGVKLELVVLDDGTATAGQYDPAQAATNARKMVSDRDVVALVGPQMSGAGKAMAPILSQGDLATITPSSTNPDITNPKFAEQYRPAGKPIYFRTVTTDAFQGPNMANYYGRDAEGEVGLHPGRQRRLRRRAGRRVPGAGREEGHQGAGPRPARPEGRRLHGRS